MDILLSPWPQQDPYVVEKAADDISEVFSHAGVLKSSAMALAAALQKRGHNAFASDQAIRLLIAAGTLECSPRPSYLPSVFDWDGNVTFQGGRCESTFPESGVIDLAIVDVQATDSLWKPKPTRPRQDSPASVEIPQEKRFTKVRSPEEIPASHRHRGLATGEPLTTAFLSERYSLTKEYLSKNYHGPVMKLGRQYVYPHAAAASLSDRISRDDGE